jgi:chitodextrinase
MSYTDTGLSSNTTYYYKVSAYNSYGESSQSSYASATTGGTAPSTPSSVTASVLGLSEGSISISWSSVSGASGYYIYRAYSSSGTYSRVTSTSGTSYTDTYLGLNTTYYYKVSAYNSNGESSLSSSYAYETAPVSLHGEDVWEWQYTLSPGGVHNYTFYATPGYYTIYWEDADYNSSYGDIRVSAITSGGTTLLNRADVGYNGQRIYVSSSGYILLRVEGYDSSSSGPYLIMYKRQ